MDINTTLQGQRTQALTCQWIRNLVLLSQRWREHKLTGAQMHVFLASDHTKNNKIWFMAKEVARWYLERFRRKFGAWWGGVLDVFLRL